MQHLSTISRNAYEQQIHQCDVRDQNRAKRRPSLDITPPPRPVQARNTSLDLKRDNGRHN